MIEYHSIIYKEFPGRGRHSGSEINECGAKLAEENAKTLTSSD